MQNGAEFFYQTLRMNNLEIMSMIFKCDSNENNHSHRLAI